MKAYITHQMTLRVFIKVLPSQLYITYCGARPIDRQLLQADLSFTASLMGSSITSKVVVGRESGHIYLGRGKDTST